jgi:benzoylformate decarboxylase
VVLGFPNNLMEQTGVRAEIIPMKPNPAPPIAPAPALVEQAARLLLEAKSPVMVAGPEITRYDAERQAVELVETLGMAATYLRFNNNYCPFPTKHPLYLVQLQRGMRVPADIDLILFLGSRLQGGGIPRGAKVIQVTTDARAVGRERPIDLGIVADPLHTAAALTQALRSMATAARLQALAAPRTETIRTFKAQADLSRQQSLQFARQRGTLGWDVMFAEMEQTLDRNAILVQEVAPYSDPMYWFDFGRDTKKLITTHTGQPGALGMGLAASIGVKLAEPDRQVVLFAGDGAMLFTQLEMLWSASRYRAPITVIVFNNRSYDMPRRRKTMEGGKQHRLGQELTSYLGDPDVNFAKVAEAFSVKGEVLLAPGEIRAALQRAMQTNREGKPYLIDALIERRGILSESTWHSPFTIAGLRTS